jgi:outer membrane murein-binding lipoprotein Lpp
MGRNNQIVRTSTALRVPAAPPAALEGEYLPPENAPKLEPIPHNDYKAIADAVNEMRENSASETSDDLAEKFATLQGQVTELEQKVETFADALNESRENAAKVDEKIQRLLAVWGDPDEATDKGGSGDTNKH